MSSSGEYPRVTEILRAVGLIPTLTHGTEVDRDRGTAVHRALELDASGRLDDSTLHPLIVPYVETYRRWVKDVGHEVEASELALSHPAYGFQGHLDRRGMVNGRRAIIDFKTGTAAPPWWRLQLAAYELLDQVARPRGQGPPQLLCLVLGPADYRQLAIPGRDLATYTGDFLAALRVWRAQQTMHGGGGAV